MLYGVRTVSYTHLILDRQKLANRDVIVEAIHSWIANNRLGLREGTHGYQCDVPGMSPVTLTVKRTKFRLPRPNPGRLLVRRQQVTNDLDKVIEEALRKKLPKLADTKADRHVLLLERDQFTLDPDPVSYTHLDVYKRQVCSRFAFGLTGIGS